MQSMFPVMCVANKNNFEEIGFKNALQNFRIFFFFFFFPVLHPFLLLSLLQFIFSPMVF